MKEQSEHITIPKKEYENLKRDVADLKEFINELPDSILRTFISHIGEEYVELKSREVYKYNEENILIGKSNYFSVNSFPIEDNKEPKPETLGLESKFIYDDLGRINQIKVNDKKSYFMIEENK